MCSRGVCYGDTTDDLIDQAKLLNENPPAREMDMLMTTGEQISISPLSMAIHGLGRKAKSLTGWQAGFRTESVHGKARITDIMPERVFKALDEGNVVIVAGFQGMSEDGDYNAWTRGSDTTAVVLRRHSSGCM